MPTDGAKTVNGLVQEQLETIPEVGTELTVGNCHIEIVASNDSMVMEARMRAESETH
ncbi:MAG: transporter associated domain-containing protein [Pseudomonadota bacterium]